MLQKSEKSIVLYIESYEYCCKTLCWLIIMMKGNKVEVMTINFSFEIRCILIFKQHWLKKVADVNNHSLKPIIAASIILVQHARNTNLRRRQVQASQTVCWLLLFESDQKNSIHDALSTEMHPIIKLRVKHFFTSHSHENLSQIILLIHYWCWIVTKLV